ncbi:MAG: hypothetical protein K0S76_168 [Herbinix sp.]|jgi:hypothetical protein|nr:hypothetical protein [Herbinix sp.]
MKKKSILSVLLTLLLALSLTSPAMAATKTSTKTVTFNSYTSKDAITPITVKVTNVTSQKTKDYSVKLGNETIAGKKSKVIYCKAPVTITLQPNKGDKHAGVYDFYMAFDSKKIKTNTVTRTDKYYAFDTEAWAYDYSMKYDTIPSDFWGYADGSTQKITKAGTYVLFVQAYADDSDDEMSDELTPVFIVVK